MATHLLTLLPLEVSTIFATARTESPALKHLTEKSRGRVVFVHLDATNTSSVKDAVTAVEKSLGGKGLDVLINNAGKQAFVSDGIVFNVRYHFVTFPRS
jgi:NAD(P)-dependent dehydrogenase (short-subunit alcohol dehydrogenase family)